MGGGIEDAARGYSHYMGFSPPLFRCLTCGALFDYEGADGIQCPGVPGAPPCMGSLWYFAKSWEVNTLEKLKTREKEWDRYWLRDEPEGEPLPCGCTSEDLDRECEEIHG